MRLINIGISLGVTSLLISSYQIIPTRDWTTFREILALSDLSMAIVGLVLCVISNKREPGKATRIGVIICIVALLLALATPNYIKGV